jgi:hypothetical protein
MQECINEIEKTFVDVKTILALQAVTACGWQIIDSYGENSSQSIRAQNNEGTVLSVQINPDKLSLDVSGLSDSSCKTHVKNVIEELNRLGVETKIDNEFEHRRKRGGTLLSYGESAIAINKVVKDKDALKRNKNVTFQTSNKSRDNNIKVNPQKEIKKEREQ